MIQIGNEAQQHFQRLIAAQDIADLGIRLRVVHAGTAKADCVLEFCEPSDLAGDEWLIECEGFKLFVEAASVRFLDAATIEFQKNATGGQLTIKAPKIKGEVPGADASIVEQVRYVLESEVAPALAAHSGRVSLVEVDAAGVVVLKFGGGCHGCGMVEITVRDGIEKTLKERVPGVTAVRDVTDHDSGTAPYAKRA